MSVSIKYSLICDNCNLVSQAIACHYPIDIDIAQLRRNLASGSWVTRHERVIYDFCSLTCRQRFIERQTNAHHQSD